jgi:hypothetical protein
METCIIDNQTITADIWEVYGHQTLLGYFDAIKNKMSKVDRKLLKKCTLQIQFGDCYMTYVQYANIINNIEVYKSLVTFDNIRLTTKQWMDKYKQHLRLKKNKL